MTDYYNILGIAKTASQEEIKRAYRKLASQHHPDKGGDTAKFQQIEEAYRILSDPQKRQEYDNPMPQNPFNGGVPPGFEDIFGSFGFGDIFNQRRRPQHAKNRNLNLETQITLQEAFEGKNLIANVRLPSGRDQTIDVKIPAGIKDGTTLRLAGMGDDSVSNIPRGDIYLSVRIMPHSIFTREQDDLIMEIKINCFEAMLGKSMQFETLDGKILETNIPAGIQPGQMLNIYGHGMPSMNDPRMKGRLLIKVGVTIPKLLTEDEKMLLKKFVQ